MEMDKPLQNNCCPYYKDLCEALNSFLHIQQNSKSLLFTAFFVSAFKCITEQRLFLFSSIVLILPLEEENGNDDADNEDHSQHRPHHPQKTLLLINNWLRIHIWWCHRIRVRAGWIHSLQEAKGLSSYTYKLNTSVLRRQICSGVFASALTFSERSSSASTKKT